MINIRGIIDAVASHAAASGLFDSVNGHEPKGAPQGHLSCAVWVDSITPLADESGLTSTTVGLVLNVRVYTSMLQEPVDAIDPEMVEAVDKLMDAYASHFTLGGNVRNIDLHGGMTGKSLSLEAGYVNIDNKLMRVLTITLPMVISDVWTEVP